jgi:arginine exporter protein ArgO
MFVCMDANFRLKNQLVSNYLQDLGLGIGLAYMLPRTPYEAYVLNQANDKDVGTTCYPFLDTYDLFLQISTCVGFQALAQANTKGSAVYWCRRGILRAL